MNIRFLGAHNIESRSSRLVSLLIDDVLAIDAGGLTSGLSFAAQLQLKSVLLTHQHYDHIRDIPALAMNFYLRDANIDIYSIQEVCDTLKMYLLDGQLYSRFQEIPEDRPTVCIKVIAPLEPAAIEGYDVLAVPVKHSVTTVGYGITSPGGKAVFYTGDTGPGLEACWERISPQLLIIEVTSPNKYSQWAANNGHLTPGLLGHELLGFRRLKGYLPQVITVHMNPMLEEEIQAEIVDLAGTLGASITLAHEGMQLQL